MGRYEELMEAFAACREKAESQRLTLGEAFERLKESGFIFVCVLQALPFLQPVALGPVSTVLGLSLATLGWQMARGRSSPWLPSRVAAWAPSPAVWRRLFGTAGKILGVCRRFTRRRLSSWVAGERGRRTGGVLIVLAGLLVSVPLVGVPFSNALPALAVVFVALGELEEDGLMLVAAAGALVLTVLYFATLAVLLVWAGGAAIERLSFPW
ncbi:MAG: exopolysaccharide biosynthesis protein [Thermoanaerobaculia bacterium]